MVGRYDIVHKWERTYSAHHRFVECDFGRGWRASSKGAVTGAIGAIAICLLALVVITCVNTDRVEPPLFSDTEQVEIEKRSRPLADPFVALEEPALYVCSASAFELAFGVKQDHRPQFQLLGTSACLRAPPLTQTYAL
jgi:hypothetical protein